MVCNQQDDVEDYCAVYAAILSDPEESHGGIFFQNSESYHQSDETAANYSRIADAYGVISSSNRFKFISNCSGIGLS